MFCDRLLVIAQASEGPGASRLGIGHRFQCGEGFRSDNEKRLRRIEILHGFHEVGAVHVGYEAKCHAPLGVVLQSLVSHHRPEIGAADADIDHIPDALAGVTFPLAATHRVSEPGHPIEHGVDFRHDIFAIDNNGCAPGSTQGYVQHRTIFGDVDLVAAKHRIDLSL